jgi:hypothetical protein
MRTLAAQNPQKQRDSIAERDALRRQVRCLLDLSADRRHEDRPVEHERRGLLPGRRFMDKWSWVGGVEQWTPTLELVPERSSATYDALTAAVERHPSGGAT